MNQIFIKSNLYLSGELNKSFNEIQKNILEEDLKNIIEAHGVKYHDRLKQIVSKMEDGKSYRINGYWYTGFMLGSIWKYLILGKDAHF